jgi:spore coat polysaccharide biosynthesis predicted glycosyltransferase SpsG
MRWADLAICAGGSTCWELAYMGVPSIILILAENQRGIAESLAEAGAADCLGWHADAGSGAITEAVARLVADPERRAALTRRGRRLVDGQGVERVVDALRDTEPRQ